MQNLISAVKPTGYRWAPAAPLI